MLIFLAFFFCFPTKVFPVTNEMLISSAKNIVTKWDNLLRDDHTLVSGDEGIWCVYRSTLIGDLSFDIQETNSIVSPYLLIISGQTRWDHNLNSIFADRENEVVSGNFGFTTKEKAMSHVKPSDFGHGVTRLYDIKLFYAYQGGSWIFKDPNTDFINFLDEKTSKGIKADMVSLMVFKVE